MANFLLILTVIGSLASTLQNYATATNICQIQYSFPQVAKRVEATGASLTSGEEEEENALNLCSELKQYIDILIGYADDTTAYVNLAVVKKQENTVTTERNIVNSNSQITKTTKLMETSKSEIASLKEKIKTMGEFKCDKPEMLDQLTQLSNDLYEKEIELNRLKWLRIEFGREMNAAQRSLQALAQSLTHLKTVGVNLNLIKSKYRLISESDHIEVLKMLIADIDELRNEVNGMVSTIKSNSEDFMAIVSKVMLEYNVTNEYLGPLHQKTINWPDGGSGYSITNEDVKPSTSGKQPINNRYANPCVLNDELSDAMQGYQLKHEGRQRRSLSESVLDDLSGKYNGYRFSVVEYDADINGDVNHAIKGYYSHYFGEHGKNVVVSWNRPSAEPQQSGQSIKSLLETELSGKSCDVEWIIKRAWELGGLQHDVRFVHAVAHSNGTGPTISGDHLSLNFSCDTQANKHMTTTVVLGKQGFL